MPVIQIDTENLKSLIKESVIDAIKTERLKFYNSSIPEVSDLEMEDIIKIHGEKPSDNEYVDITEWFLK